MKRYFDHSLWMKWVAKVGGPRKAIVILIERTDMATSTADKLVTGRYTGVPKSLRRGLLQVTRSFEDDLFPLVKSKERTS